MLYQPFSTFDDPGDYGGFVPSSQWLQEMYDKLIEDHGIQIDQKVAMLPAEICAIYQSQGLSLCYHFLIASVLTS